MSCRFEFCWMCLGRWAPHGQGFYSCNIFNDKEAKKARDEQGRSRAALQRYLHYYNRYANHQNSLKLEFKVCDIFNIFYSMRVQKLLRSMLGR